MALDSRGANAVRPWIELNPPSYPCLIDAQHQSTDLYGISNVPTAMWIDENGRMIRPPEGVGSGSFGATSPFSGPAYSEPFRAGRFDRATGHLTPEGVAALHDARRPLVEALSEWVEQGATRAYALPPERAREQMRLPSGKQAQATVLFKLGLYLFQNRETDEANGLFQRATDLWPDSISMLRQWGDIEVPGSMGGERFFRKMREAQEQTPR